jgi:hypothetical protein
LLSREEFRVFKIAEEEAAAARQGHRAFATSARSSTRRTIMPFTRSTASGSTS